jgi:hypothetical protein
LPQNIPILQDPQKFTQILVWKYAIWQPCSTTLFFGANERTSKLDSFVCFASEGNLWRCNSWS